MTDLRTAAQEALEAWDGGDTEWFKRAYTVMDALRAALAEPVQEPVAGRAFFERILAAMEGVIDVADRKTDEFDALRSCVIDLTLMLHTAPPQRPAEPVQEPVAWRYKPMIGSSWSLSDDGYYISCKRDKGYIVDSLYTTPPQRKPLTEEEIDSIWDSEKVFPNIYAIARAIERAHGITP